MAAPRATSLIATCDQWSRAWHQGTAVDGAPGALTLSWTEPAGPGPQPGAGCVARGLAVDRLCRVYRLSSQTVHRLAVGPTRHGVDYARLGAPVEIIGRDPAPTNGPDFQPRPEPMLADGAGIAIDADDRLFLADRGRRWIAVLDLWSRRTLRTILTPGDPMGLAASGRVVHALLRDPATLLRLTATGEPAQVPLPGASYPGGLPPGAIPPGSEPSRVAVLPDGTPVVLWHAPDGTGWLAAHGRAAEELGAASDIVVDVTGAVVVAPCAGKAATLRRFVPTATGWTRTLPLDATGYDGSGLVATADGRIGYWTASGFRLAARGRVRYVKDGACVTYRLDSGRPGNQWGRIILDGCLPPGTDCRIATATSDDDFETALPAAPADPAACTPSHGVTPDLPPAGLVPAATGALHRRRDAPTPWWRPAAGDPVDVFEAPVQAPPGRYLWVSLRLTGDGSRTPSIRALRVEHQAHDLVRRLPTVFDEGTFLHRYLAMFDSLLHDLDQRAARRDILVDPAATPVEALPWLASFAGLVLDDRWPEQARRRLLAEIVALYRRRGTAGALTRYLELYLGRPPVIIEHFRLRGLAGSTPVAGLGFRVGGGDPNAPDGSAHRFTVVVPQPLTGEQEAAVRHVLDTERPAHTDYDLCTVDAGMRAGSGLHVGLTSLVGPTGAMSPLVVGASAVTAGTVVGGSGSGLPVEAGRLDRTARVG
jgi:phage tail-like protein